jgi:asparagine synthase (glutamine-hydrolysing)
MVEKLRGMYTFAIWDEDKRGMFLARDPYGIKPLYLADDCTTLRFASSVKALIAGRSRRHRARARLAHRVLPLGPRARAWTLVRGVRALGAGSSLWLAADGARDERRFFDLSATLRDAGPAPADAGARARC